jgi:hypothetical protein
MGGLCGKDRFCRLVLLSVSLSPLSSWFVIPRYNGQPPRLFAWVICFIDPVAQLRDMRRPFGCLNKCAVGWRWRIGYRIDHNRSRRHIPIDTNERPTPTVPPRRFGFGLRAALYPVGFPGFAFGHVPYSHAPTTMIIVARRSGPECGSQSREGRRRGTSPRHFRPVQSPRPQSSSPDV